MSGVKYEKMHLTKTILLYFSDTPENIYIQNITFYGIFVFKYKYKSEGKIEVFDLLD